MNARKWLLAAAGLLYPPLVAAAVYLLAVVPLPSRHFTGPGLLSALSILLAVMATANLATPWLRRSRWLADAARLSPPGDPAERCLLFGLPFTAAPASYGLILFVIGSGPAVAATFAAASLLGAAAWIWRSLSG